MSIGTMTFAGAGLDRADHIRADADKLAELMDWRARLLRLDGLDPLITPDGTLDWGTLADADAASEVVFLFLNVERSFFHHIQDFTGAFNEELPRWRERKFMLVTVEKLDAQRCFQLHELPA